jgi:hypothetical protein
MSNSSSISKDKEFIKKIFAKNNWNFDKILNDKKILKELNVDLRKIEEAEKFIKAHPLSSQELD